MRTKRFTFLNRILLTGIFMFAFTSWMQAQVIHFENFDSESNGGTSCTSTQTLSSTMWSNVTGDDKDWVADNGGTVSSSTGPNIDHTLGNSTGKYLYTEASSCYSKTAYLVSNTLNLSGYSAFYLDFYYHMYGSSMGTLSVEVSTNGGSTWSTALWYKTGQQHTSYTATWSMASVDLSAYTGTGMSTVKIRIKGYTGTAYTSDMAIDDITLWAPVANDAAITAITSPSGSISPGAQDVKVTLMNNGSATLTQANLKYSVNGGTASTYAWSGSLTSGNSATSINLGSHTFTTGVAEIKAWSESPNGNTDGDHSNDTSTTTVYVCSPLSGTYTIGGAGADFADFASAVNQAQNCGVSGPVTFNVASGTYTEQVTIGAIPGASATNTITFQSASGDSTDVILQHAASTSSTNNYTLLLDDADYIIFKDLTIKRTGTSQYYGTVIELANNADYNKFMNCQILGYNYSSNSYSNYRCLVYNYTSTNCDYNEFHNNYMQYGCYGIYWYGASSTTREDGNKFIGNVMEGQYYRAAMFYYQSGLEFVGNTVSNTSGYTSVYLFYGYYCGEGTKITHNNFSKTNNGFYYGLYLSSCDGSSSNRNLVANNFISANRTSSGSCYAIYNTGSDFIDYYNNSVNLTGTSTYTSSRCFYYTTGSSVNVKNNNFVNSIGGYSVYYSGTSVSSADNNNLYTSGTNLAYWSGNNTSLAALQTASGKDANSISVNPTFTSATDLHTGDFQLNAKGTSLTEVTDDIDGEARTPTPDIGADEFTPVGKDAAINWVAPVVPTAAGNKTIKVEVANAMTVAITSVNLTYTDGTTPVTQSFTGLNIAQGTSDTLSFTTPFSFTGPSNLRAYINNVNGTADLVQTNDTTTWQSLVPALSGTYTINKTQATGGTNFNSFTDAVAALNNGGVDGAVTFNVAADTYTEQITIGSVIGASSSSPITFQSVSGTNTDVTLTYAASSLTNPHTVKLNGASHISFKNMTLAGTGASYARTVWVSNNSTYCTFEGNIITAPNSTSSYRTPVYIQGGNNHYLNITDNTVNGGYYGIYCSGSGTSSRDMGNSIDGNEVSNFYYYGIYMYYQNDGELINNYVHSGTNTTQYGLRTGYFYDGGVIAGNKVEISATSTNYGLYSYNHNYYYYASGTESPVLVYNNMISIDAGTSTAYGIFDNYCDKTDYYYNSVNMIGSSTSHRALYQYNTASNTTGTSFKNNSFVNTAGYAAYFNSPTSVAASDYNNFHTTGSNFAYWSGARANLSALQSASSKDANSVSMDPTWFSATDLHTKSLAFNNLGTPITGITTDIDGDTRDASTPDIGCDEFDPPARDIAVTNISPINAVSGNQSIMIDFSTYGTATLTSAQFNFSVNGTANSTPYTWSGSLTNGQSANGVNIGSYKLPTRAERSKSLAGYRKWWNR